MTFRQRVMDSLSEPMKAVGIDVLQANLGYRCNMSCKHCHVGAGAARGEAMDEGTAGAVLDVLKKFKINSLDITGGAPELNPNFRDIVLEATTSGSHVISRCNLTIFFEDGMDWLPEFYSKHGVEIIASLPAYDEGSVDRVRGEGAFKKSINALRMLNVLGYGNGSDKARLNLVFNPMGAFLPPDQAGLEVEYKRRLQEDFGIVFDRLYTFANMPVGRFKDFLVRSGNLEKYMDGLSGAFNPTTLEGVMCRHIINVGWDGTLYDCDFNQMAGLGLAEGCPDNIGAFDAQILANREISLDEHCYGCTAGQGST